MDNRPVNQHFSQSSAAAVLPHQQASRYQSLLSLFPFYPSPFLIDRAIFCFSVISSFSILQDISFFPSLLLTFAISSYISILLSTTFHIVIKNIPNYTHLSPFHFFRQFHRISSSPNHFTIHLHTVSTPQRQPFDILSFACISCHFISHHSHGTNKHNSLSIISCPNPFLPIITITFSSHNNSSHCIPTFLFPFSFILLYP